MKKNNGDSNRISRWVSSMLVLVSLGVLVCVNNSCSGKKTDSAESTAATEKTAEQAAIVQQYVDFVSQDTTRIALDHHYCSEALLKLADATKIVAESVGIEKGAELDQVRTYANQITQDPLVDTHADAIRKASVAISEIMGEVQAAKFPELSKNAEDLKMAASQIDPAVLTLQQKDAVNAFFLKSAKLLDLCKQSL